MITAYAHAGDIVKLRWSICKTQSFRIHLKDSLITDGGATDDAEAETLEMYLAISCKHVLVDFRMPATVICWHENK
jgi:hypothetical protein